MEKVNLLFKIQTIKSIDIYMINTFHNLLLLIFTDQPEKYVEYAKYKHILLHIYYYY